MLETQKNKRNIFISGVNIVNGGPLTVYKNCLKELISYIDLEEYYIYAIVNDKKLFSEIHSPSLEYIEIPSANKSYLHKIYYEYYYFNKLSKNYNVFFWLSINDVSPNISISNRAVYCHNATIIYSPKISDIFFQPKILLFKYTYWLIFRTNLEKNKFVIVQQHWFRNEFIKRFKIDPNKVVVNSPKSINTLNHSSSQHVLNSLKTFIFPSLPRGFKNFEIIGEAVSLLVQKGIVDFKVYFTINGNENVYSKWVKKKYSFLNQLEFIGYQSTKELEEYYTASDCLLFPSKLETWGLPITEFKSYGRPIFVADLPYAYEVVGDYQYAKYFNPNDAQVLADLMEQIILEKQINFTSATSIEKYSAGTTYCWQTLFEKMLKN